MATNEKKRGIYLLKNEDKSQYVYFPNINSVFKVSLEVVDFLNGTINKEVEAEIESILNMSNGINDTIRRIIYFTVGIREISTLEMIFEKDRDYAGNVFLELCDNDNSMDEYITDLSSALQYKGLNVNLKKKISNSCEGSSVELCKENNIIVRCNLDQLKEMISQNTTLSLIVELDLQNVNELEELFDELHLPDNLRILLNGHANNTVATKIVDKLSNVISDFFVNYEKSKFINVAYLLNAKIGLPITDLDVIRVDKNGIAKGQQCKACNECWARTLCWDTNAYYIFSSHPSLTSKEGKNCELIRELITNLLVLRLANKDNLNNKEYLPQIFTLNGFKIRLINP